MTDKTYHLIFEVAADSDDEATEDLREDVANDPDNLIPDNIVRPGDARLIGLPVWADISETFEAPAGSILLAPVTILGTPMHLGAIRVSEDDGSQTAAAAELNDELEKVYAFYDTGLQTTDVDGFEGQYVVYATPHGA